MNDLRINSSVTTINSTFASMSDIAEKIVRCFDDLVGSG